MSRRTVVDPQFVPRLRELLDERGMSFRALAARTAERSPVTWARRR